jgi:NADPH2:quinone reductase
VLIVGEMPDPTAGPGEVRIRLSVSGVNPGDVKKRRDAYGYGMRYPRVVPHSDGAGAVDQVGDGVSSAWLGRRVWCYGAQSYRPFGTAAEYTVVPVAQAVPLPDGAPLEQGACLGIPGITAHRAVHVADPVRNRVVLVQGGAGAVGLCAVRLARDAGAHVIATVRSAGDDAIARAAGAHEVVGAAEDLAGRIRRLAPEGVDHVIEVAFGSNVAVDAALVAQGGSIATYASEAAVPQVPFWPLVFQNVRVFFLGSDDFPADAKAAAARDLNAALDSGWTGLPIGDRVALADIARAHEMVEEAAGRGRVVVTI